MISGKQACQHKSRKTQQQNPNHFCMGIVLHNFLQNVLHLILPTKHLFWGQVGYVFHCMGDVTETEASALYSKNTQHTSASGRLYSLWFRLKEFGSTPSLQPSFLRLEVGIPWVEKISILQSWGAICMTQRYASIKKDVYPNTKIARGKARKEARFKNIKNIVICTILIQVCEYI